MARKRRGRAGRQEALWGWTFFTPFGLLYLIVFIIPIIVAIKSSFYREVSAGGGLYGGGQSRSQFVGVENFEMVIKNGRFWGGMARVIGYTIIQVPIMLIFAMALALVIDSFLLRRPGGLRLGFFLPYAIPGIIAAMVWLYLYTPQISPLVRAMRAIGININLTDPGWVLGSMANMTTWTYTGYNMLIFLAALQAIPHDLYEAARIDGATGWQVTTKIKIPLLGKALLLAMLLSIIGTIQLFNEPTVLASAHSWMGKDYTPMMMAYNSMMGTISPGGDGPASAISLVMAVIAGVLAAIYAFAQGKVK